MKDVLQNLEYRIYNIQNSKDHDDKITLVIHLNDSQKTKSLCEHSTVVCQIILLSVRNDSVCAANVRPAAGRRNELYLALFWLVWTNSKKVVYRVIKYYLYFHNLLLRLTCY